jgi:hypothetical protein
MRLKAKLLQAHSFRPQDIPNNFWVVIDLGLNNLDYNPEIYQRAYSGLSQGILDGVRGISNSGQILRQFGYRGAFMRLPGPEVVELNKLSRVMYDNPNYLVSKGMAALYRIFDKNPEQRYGHQGLMQNVGEYVLKGLQGVNYKAYNDLKYFGADSRIGQSFGDHPVQIDTVDQLAKYIFQQWDKEWHERYNAPQAPFTLEDIREAVSNGLHRVGQTFNDEGEWFVKDGQLRIPRSSTLVVSVDAMDEDIVRRWEGQPEQVKEMKERSGPLYKDYMRVLQKREKMEELRRLPFRVNFLDSKSFKQSIDKMMENRYSKSE